MFATVRGLRAAFAFVSIWIYLPDARAQNELESPAVIEELTGQELDDDVVVSSGFGPDQRAAQGYDAWIGERFIEARELAESILADDPESAIGHGLLGAVLHRGEGNLPRARFHLEQGRTLLEACYGPLPDETAPWMWHYTILAELAFVSGEMGRHDDKLRYLELRDEVYEPRWPADRGWPLMRLRRYDEARSAVGEALALEDRPLQAAAAMTALCAIEAEQQQREAAYRACRDAAQWDRDNDLSSPSSFTNAAEAALGMLELGEAERFILEATELSAAQTVANPWLDLLRLYVGQNRIAEALTAVDKMIAWRLDQPAFMDEQNRTETEMGAAQFLIGSGYPHEAAKITHRALERPDRTGFTSSDSKQMMAAAALADHIATTLAAELLRERATWSRPWEAIQALFAAQRLRFRAWTSARRSISLIASEEMLNNTLRPYLAGGVEAPEWMIPELVQISGPGVISAALETARSSESMAQVEAYFLVLDAEIAHRTGRFDDAELAATAALAQLPPSERLLRARSAAIGAHGAAANGQRTRAMELFDLALQADRVVTRRLGIALPTRFETKGRSAVGDQTIELLRKSPRFDDTGWGMRVQVQVIGSRLEGCLLTAEDSVIGCSGVEASAEAPRQLAEALHREAFSSRIDLSQSDIGSLEGSPTAGGGRAHERIQELVSALGLEG